MTLEEELEIAKTRIMEEINFIDDDPSYRSGLTFALEVIREECSSNNKTENSGAVGKITAPWTEEQVKALEARQDMEMLHEYTCECGHQLIPSKDGWFCEECPYTQNWCHALDVKMPKMTEKNAEGQDAPSIELLDQSFKGLITELKASMMLNCKTQEDRVFNHALSKAVTLAERYRRGEGLFQQ